MATGTSSLLVAAFDFGTTYSGYAFSFRDNPRKVQTNHTWYSGGAGKLISLKTPTSVLLNPDGEFDSFGFEAEDSYASKAEDGEHEGWRLFRRFKMVLHNNQNLSRATTVEDLEGKTHPAMPIFSMSIKFLQTHLLESVAKQIVGIRERDISYIITVPAIWDDNAKEFMRMAAEKAGLDGNRLKLALEPEAASVWCETGGVDAKIADPGTKFMVIDLGGGTADISVHEKKLDGTLKAIHKASGGPWGGVYVDANYIRFLERVFSRRAIADLKKKEMSDYFDVIREFETKKRCFSEKAKSKITFKISAATRNLSEKYTRQKLEQRIEYLGFGDSVVLKGGDKLRVEPDIVQAWFDDPIDRLVVHLNNILCLPTMRAVQTVVLIGGFGESAYVQERLRAEIPVTRLFVPGEAGLVVLKGAVSFGHNPSIISSRVMNYTYGVAANIIYDEKIHSKDKRFLANDGHWRVHNGIAVYARVNTEVPEDQQITQEFIPNNYCSNFNLSNNTGEPYIRDRVRL